MDTMNFHCWGNRKITLAVWEPGVSASWGTPEIPRSSPHYRIEGLTWVSTIGRPFMLRDASLSDSQCNFFPVWVRGQCVSLWNVNYLLLCGKRGKFCKNEGLRNKAPCFEQSIETWTGLIETECPPTRQPKHITGPTPHKVQFLVANASVSLNCLWL